MCCLFLVQSCDSLPLWFSCAAVAWNKKKKRLNNGPNNPAAAAGWHAHKPPTCDAASVSSRLTHSFVPPPKPSPYLILSFPPTTFPLPPFHPPPPFSIRVFQGHVAAGSGEPGADEYHSLVLYHNNSPRWAEQIKLPIPVDMFRGSHVRFEFRHCSSK